MTELELMALGRAVRRARKRLGLRQKDLARQVGVPVSCVQYLEQGKYQGIFPVRYAHKVALVRRWLQEQTGQAGRPTGR